RSRRRRRNRRAGAHARALKLRKIAPSGWWFAPRRRMLSHMRARLARRALAVPVVLATLTGSAATAVAQTGGVGPDQPSPAPSPVPSGGATGGVRYGQHRPRPKARPVRGPPIVSLAVAPGAG